MVSEIKNRLEEEKENLNRDILWLKNEMKKPYGKRDKNISEIIEKMYEIMRILKSEKPEITAKRKEAKEQLKYWLEEHKKAKIKGEDTTDIWKTIVILRKKIFFNGSI